MPPRALSWIACVGLAVACSSPTPESDAEQAAGDHLASDGSLPATLGTGADTGGGSAGARASAGGGGAQAAASDAGGTGLAGAPDAGLTDGSPGDCVRQSASLQVMTFNIRYDGGGAGSLVAADGWANPINPRRERVLGVFAAVDPDLIGVQEALSNQVSDLILALGDEYEFWGVGRDDGAMAGEYAGIFYRSDRFTQRRAGHFWLSETPETPGTVFAGSGSIRMASWVELFDRLAEAPLLLLNSHWDNVSQPSREKSAALIRDRLEELGVGLPWIVVGDFNAVPVNPAISILLGSGEPDEIPLLDGYRAVHPVPNADEATYHDFTGNPAGERIDFVLHTEAFAAREAAIHRTEFASRYPSDHFPVSVTFDWSGAGGTPETGCRD